VMLSVAAGSDLKWFYTDKGSNLFRITELDDSPLQSIEDLRGKTLGVTGMESGEMPMVRAVLARAGLIIGQDVSIVPVGEQAAGALNALQTGAIDAYGASDTEFVPIEALGQVKLRSINYPEYDHMPSEGLFVTAETLEADPDLAIGIARAIAKVSYYCQVSPEACLSAMKEVVPEEHDDVEYAWRFWDSVIDQKTFHMEGGEYVFGYNDAAGWQTNMEMLMSGEGDERALTEPLDFSTIVVDDYIDEINDFDHAAIAAEAKAYAAAHPYPPRPGAEAVEMRELSFLLPFIKTIAFYPVFIADAMGYFAEEGLSVEIQPVDGSSFVVQQVAAGRAEAGLAGTGAVLNGMEEGLPFWDVMRWMWTQTFPLITWAESGVTSIADLDGQVIGISEAGGGDVPALEAFLRDAGLEPYVDVQLLPVGENVPSIITAFEEGQIAAYSSSWNRNISFRAAGFDLVELTPDAFRTLPAEDVVVSIDFYENSPELVAGLCRAIAKGMLVGLENPAAALAIMQQVTPEEHDDTAYAWLYMEGAQETVRPPMQDGRYYFGIFDFDEWQRFVDLAGEKEFDLTAFLTNDFIEEINNFDYDQVIDEAADYAAAHPYPEKP